MIKVKRLGHATLATPDIERQVDYWTGVMGLQVVDASQEGWGVLNHDLFLSNAHIWKVIRAAIDARVANARAALTPPS